MTLADLTHVFAEPGARSCIDFVHPNTGKSLYGQETLEEVRKRYPRAELISYDDWSAARAKEQDAPVKWLASSEESYHEALECLPPSFQASGSFLVGEPMDHHVVSGKPRYTAHIHRQAGYFVSDRPVTVAEFRELIASVKSCKCCGAIGVPLVENFCGMCEDSGCNRVLESCAAKYGCKLEARS